MTATSQDLENYLELYEHAPVGYLLLGADSTIHDINAAGAGMLGWPREWLFGKPLGRWVAREDQGLLAAHLAAATDQREAVVEDLRIKQRSGRRAEVRLHTSGARGECRSVMLDLSESRQAERQARAMQERLAHLMRLGTVGHLASSLAHELNQPLGTIVLNCDSALHALRAQGAPPPEVVDALERATECAAYAAELVRHLRRLVRGDGGERVAVALAPIVARTLQLIEPAARDADAKIEAALPDELPQLLASPVQVEQVLVNLLSNSLEAMRHNATPTRRVTVSACSERAAVRITVRDTGPGMDARTAEQAFLPFYSSKDEGLGMGLPVCRSIIEAHGGRLWAEPDGDCGTVHFLLPRAR